MPGFSGSIPGSNGAAPPAQQTPGATPGSTGGVSTPNNEGVGSIPIAGNPGSSDPASSGTGSSGSNGGGSAGAGAGGSTAMPPAQGTAGSAAAGAAGGSMVGAGGSANAGAAGAGSVPPGNTDPPAQSACAAGELFCEDFEGLPIGPLTGTVNGMRIDRTVDVLEEPGRGRVLRVQAGTGYGNKSGFFLDLTPPNNSLFGRAFIRVQQFPTTGGDHWVLFEATQAGGGGEQVRPVGGQFSRWAAGSDGPSAGDWTDWEQSNVATNAGVYECVEWQINGANGGNDMTLWVNGTEARPQDRANFRLPTIGQVWLGFVVYQTNQPPMHDVRFDDVVLSTARVGCN